jgi:formylmethanofuran dehydrogenase subunit B
MAVAWIGNREASLADAMGKAAELLAASRCPVFSLDTDVHGTRAAIALAERVGAAYDLIDGEAVAREAAVIAKRGGMFMAPGEARRRADVMVLVGELPPAHDEFVAGLAHSSPDLGKNKGASRKFFLIGNSGPLPRAGKAVRLTCGNVGLAGTLAAVRAQCAGRKVARPVANIEEFRAALADAQFAAFLFCGHGTDALTLEMLQGLISDLSNGMRASAVHLPASENGWGTALVSTWTTGFPPRTGFSRGSPEHDPWRWSAERMLRDGEADLHLWLSAGNGKPPAPKNGAGLIVLAGTDRAARAAAVTVRIGEPGVDHDAVAYSSRTGTLTAIAARSLSELSPAAQILRSIADKLPEAQIC